MAHEFWLQPQKFFYSIRDVAYIRFFVGEHFSGTNWNGNKDKVKLLVHFDPSGISSDLSARLSDNLGDSLSLPLKDEGTHMVIFNSTNSFIKLEAEKFNEYLKEDGLDNTALYRIAQKEDTLAGREYYQRSVKTLIQVGESPTNRCTNPTQLPLDIIPRENPYMIPVRKSGMGIEKVRFRVLFKGEPLENALVKIWYYSRPNQVAIETARTNKRGWVTTDRHSGPFLVSCVHMEKATRDTIADWQSYWASLSFEYSQFYN